MRAIAIVREDISGCNGEADVAGIRALARRMRLDLSTRDIHVTSELSVLLAHLTSACADVVLVPSEGHLRGWMNEVRRMAAVWTVEPALCWPQGGGRVHAITRPDRHIGVAR
ncbi:hypothetical protein C5E45_20445 [Nocardia nova]|uniref:Uncharacterized protein n=1 Tax=Nocardia nova TaxID=37330 RepID=A0A2S6AMQ2_9NOCA|nr:hypothetical protein C5E45_20445 [Nocardia nova]